MWPRSASSTLRDSVSPDKTADDDVVEGIVLMRRGEQSMPTIERVKAEVDVINRSGVLPPGVRIERIYDRSDLIRLTTHTVLHNVLAGVTLIFLLQWAFLGNLRSALIVACTIPFALDICDRADDPARRIRQSALGRRHRFRPDRRCLGDHGRGDFPSSERRRGSAPYGFAAAAHGARQRCLPRQVPRHHAMRRPR